ncbi:dihydroneopterin aldolase [Mucilaginibacter mallensis]|uniref:7,8-dihydroneopterin aldolase n=1 Tax=Mucilaginibacter mallensis TaxID=652787 RepID=A0A1H1US63_MUCMA|nr:dihydroneopterin aldolase [Mucilaginibacter mallensis]SDS75120.1 dihydroneopterin aldolase [Mucilaginibacter mallensis]
MVEINLNDAEFFAFHGFYPEEQLLGSRFLVDISVGFRPTGNLLADEIGNTVNYEQLYNIACEEMKHTRKLIETVGQSIIDAIKSKFPFVDHVRVCIKKVSPPLKGKVGHSSVTITSFVD